MTTSGLVMLGLAGAVEGAAALIRHDQRTGLFAAARARADELGRTLVVIGDPSAGAHTGIVAAYGCGDACVDLTGCPGCSRGIKADITKGQVAAIGDGSAVVFVSCVLEYVDGFDAAWNEILRMSGGVDNVFVAVVQPWTLTAAMYPGARQLVIPKRQDGARNPSYVAVPVSTARKVVSYGAVAGLVLWALWPSR